MLVVNEHRVSFLTTGPPVRVVLPDEFHELPELSSPVSLEKGGRGREFVFLPHWLGDNLEDNPIYTSVQDLTDPDGRDVEVFLQSDHLQWFLRWRVEHGSVVTHVRSEDDGERWVEVVATHVRVLENGGLPSVVPLAPLTRMASTRTGYAERIAFFSGHPSEVVAAVELRRPGVMRSGSRVQRWSQNGMHTVERGGPRGIDVVVSGRPSFEDAEQLATVVGQGMVE